MSIQTNIEQDILDVTGFVPEKKYRDRQKYLEALLRAVVDADNDTYEKLDDDTCEWSIRAARLHKQGKELPDFAPTSENGEDHDADQVSDDLVQESTSSDAEASDENEGEGVDVDQPQEKKVPKKRGRKPGTKVKIKAEKPKKVAKEKVERTVNRWGRAAGTHADIVCRLLAQEGGTTMKDIIAATGHARYNVVNSLQRQGHKIIKDGLNIRMIHKDDL